MNLRQLIVDQKFEQLNGVNVYLFGSALYNDAIPMDVDLAIIYDKYCVSIQEVISYRIYLKNIIKEKLNYSSDILLLSIQEEIEAEFLSNAKNYQVI